MKEILCGYLIVGKLPKGEFKRLISGVIDFDKGVPHQQCYKRDAN